MAVDRGGRPALAALDAAALYRRCDPESLPFETTAELDDRDISVGQSRALEALDFGVRIQDRGCNLFVLGRTGSGRHRIVEDFLNSHRGGKEAPPDWCYLNNFDDERKPIAVSLPRGRGSAFRGDMARLVEELREAIPAAFASDQYTSSVDEINQEFEDRHKAAIETLQEEAKQHDTSLVRTPHGFAIAPTEKGEVLSDEQFEKLDEKEKQRRTDAMEQLSVKLRQHIERMPQWHKEHRDRIKALNRELTDKAAAVLIDQLTARYRDVAQLDEYLEKLKEHVLANAGDFHAREEPSAQPSGFATKEPLTPYAVNLLVEQSAEGVAPIVYENNPSIQNLLGRVEHISQFGALVTNFTMIRPGALHRANGGYLILDADRLLTEPLAWDALKRALSSDQIRIESLGELLSLASTVSLEPEAILLDVKVLLIGERYLYYLLSGYDAEFGELFKVAADFENRIDRTPENTALYGQLIGNVARREGMLPLNREAVARTIEHSSRLQGDSEKLTTRLRDVFDLVRQANFWANEEKVSTIGADHVQKAIDAHTRRLDRMRSEIQEEIQRNSILIDTDGAKVGQVNGLSVLTIGDYSFGQPSRITAGVRVGDGSIVDIERETELGGPIHSKGVLILSAYLRSRYAGQTPLSISASLVFEQSYSGVEGDSASVAETCALLSAISSLPLSQSLAVTGSVNQHGQVQVIGAVNEKIEGFFETCQARGLTGAQGVLIPKDNVQHLMLRQDVIDAVRDGRFHVYPIETVDDATTLLMGIAAGERNARGAFPKGTVNYVIEKNLKTLAEQRRDFGNSLKRRKKRKKASQANPSGDGP